jgi:hypothetical protein
MTIKELEKISSNDDAIAILLEMQSIKQNMASKTIYEQKTSNNELKRLAKELMVIIAE